MGCKKEMFSVKFSQIARPDVASCPGAGAGGLPEQESQRWAV
jgi:hypothetical protein